MNTPWTASTDGEWWDVVGQDGATIARFRGNQHESLARLIAAAPDLLAAAYEAVSELRDYFSIPRDADDDYIYDEMGSGPAAAYFSARAAIAKATGAA